MPDAEEFGGPFAHHMDAEQLASVLVGDQLEQAFGDRGDLPSRELGKERPPTRQPPWREVASSAVNPTWEISGMA